MEAYGKIPKFTNQMHISMDCNINKIVKTLKLYIIFNKFLRNNKKLYPHHATFFSIKQFCEGNLSSLLMHSVTPK